jgi:hypothetical protein
MIVHKEDTLMSDVDGLAIRVQGPRVKNDNPPLGVAKRRQRHLLTSYEKSRKQSIEARASIGLAQVMPTRSGMLLHSSLAIRKAKGMPPASASFGTIQNEPYRSH